MIEVPSRPVTLTRVDRMQRVEGAQARPGRTDLRFAALVTVGLLLVSSVPYFMGYSFSTTDKQFMGLAGAVHDYAQYMSWARESANGLLVENKLTAEQTGPAFFNLLWWGVGHIENSLGVSFFAVNQLLRCFAIALFVFAAHRVCVAMFGSRLKQRYALVLACVASGFGWVLIPIKSISGILLNSTLVFNSPGNTIVGATTVPHQLLAASILLSILLLVFDGYRANAMWRLIIAGGLGLVLGLTHTYDLVTAYAVTGIFGLLVTLRDGLRPRWVAGLAAFYGLSAPAVLFWLFLSASSPAWREVLAQFRNLGVFTPDPLQLMVLLGAPLLLAILTFRGLVPLASRSDRDLFLYAWLGAVAVIIYLPVTFQIMMLNGFQVALGALATIGLFEHVLPWVRHNLAERPTVAGWLGGKRLAAVAGIVFLVLVLPTNVYLVSQRVLDLSRRNYPEFLYRDDVAALDWLARQVQPTDVILSSMEIGHFVPGWTGAHAFLAHGAGTLAFNAKRSMTERFYAADTSDQERREILDHYGVRYVFQGPAERLLGSFDPDGAAYLRIAFTSTNTRIFEVVQASS